MKFTFNPYEMPFAVGNVNYVRSQRSEGYKVSFPEGRSQNAFIFTTCGTMKYSILNSSGNDLMAAAGDFVFLPCGTKHSSSYMDSENIVELVQFDLIIGEFPDYLSAPTLLRNCSVEKIFSSIHTDMASGIGNNPMYFLYRVYELFWHISQNNQKLPAKFRKLKLPLKELHLYFADNQKIQYYADLCNMSEPGFRRLFREYTNLSPIEYRNQIRLQEAKKLLGSGEFTVEEVALQVGFSNLSFFCRTYKQQFGHSPGKEM